MEQFVAMAHWGTYVAAHMGMLIDNFETWVDADAGWGRNTSSTAQEFYPERTQYSLDEDNYSDVQACVWVKPHRPGGSGRSRIWPGR